MDTKISSADLRSKDDKIRSAIGSALGSWERRPEDIERLRQQQAAAAAAAAAKLAALSEEEREELKRKRSEAQKARRQAEAANRPVATATAQTRKPGRPAKTKSDQVLPARPRGRPRKAETAQTTM